GSIAITARIVRTPTNVDTRMKLRVLFMGGRLTEESAKREAENDGNFRREPVAACAIWGLTPYCAIRGYGFAVAGSETPCAFVSVRVTVPTAFTSPCVTMNGCTYMKTLPIAADFGDTK